MIRTKAAPKSSESDSIPANRAYVSIPPIKNKSIEKEKLDEREFDVGGIPANPYMNVKDVSELPVLGTSTSVSLGNRSPPHIESKEPSYNFIAPIERSGTVNELVERILDSNVTLKTSELLSAAKPIREELKARVSQQKVPAKTLKSNRIQSQFEGIEFDSDAIDVQALPAATWEKIETVKSNNGETVSAYVVGDVVLQYLEALAPEEKPKQIVVASDSQSLRSIYPLLNGRMHLECLLDSGSQIVSISQDKAEKTGLVWDPDIVIYMQSANKGLDRSLGLARNVPFLFCDMTVLLQVHVIRSPAYDVLLGRPFDTILQTQIQNFADGRQIVTLTDPMTTRRLTIPTFARGTAAIMTKRPPDVDISEKPNEKKVADEDSETKPKVQGFLLTSMN
jgi:hypothetical protein